MKKTIVWKGKTLIYSKEHHGYIDPESHGGIGDIHSIPVWRVKRKQKRIRRPHKK